MAKKYPEPTIEKALTLAATIGIRPAARELDIPQATIQVWTQDRAARYSEIKALEAPRWRERAAAETENIVESLAALERQATEQLAAALPSLEPKEVSGALKNITVAKGINADHVAKLRGQPATVVEHQINMPQIDKALDLLLNRGESVVVDAEVVQLDNPPAVS